MPSLSFQLSISICTLTKICRALGGIILAILVSTSLPLLIRLRQALPAKRLLNT